MIDDVEDAPPEGLANDGNVDAIIQAAMELCEAYVAWAFEERELHRAGRGDEIAKKFRAYVALTHPKEFALMKLAERGFKVPKVIIHED